MEGVNASIITIGDELLIGQTIDTNSAFIGRELNKIGIWVKRRTAVGDEREDILQALEENSKDCQVIIITGGLGPTADDITKPVLCEYFGCGMAVNQEALDNVKDIFTKLNRPLIERNLKQAEVPESCTVLPNKKGTAPGMWFEKAGVRYISLPGVPNEMKGIFLDCVIPRLQDQLDLPVVIHRTLVTAGVGESAIAELIASYEDSLPPHIRLAYLPAYSIVRLRLTARGMKGSLLENEIALKFEELQAYVKHWMVADEDMSIAAAVNQLLRSRKKTLSTAESCTGGYISHLLTSIAGSSDVFAGGVVSYAYQAKEDLLNVSRSTLQRHGAVSEETVIEMTKGVLGKLGTDYAIATSGIMGPGGGTAEKPKGTVWIAIGNKDRIRAAKHFFRFDRERNIEMTANMALTLLYRFINEEEGDVKD